MKTLKILHLEDDPLDTELALATLEEAGYQCEVERIQTREDFLACLDEPNYNIILADYTLPSFDGLTALRLFNEKEINIPFILVSGSLGEEVAIKSLKSGADNYVLKDHLPRLAPAVEQALQEHRLREAERQHVANLELFRELNQAANRGADLQELITILAEKTRAIFSGTSATILMTSDDSKHLKIQLQSLPKELLKQLETLLQFKLSPVVKMPILANTLYCRVIKNRESQLLDGREEIEALIQNYIDSALLSKKTKTAVKRIQPRIQRLLNYEAAYLSPLVAQGKAIGLIIFSRSASFTEEDISRMEGIADQASGIFSRKLAEKALRESEERYRTIFETSPVSLWEEDFSGIVTAIEEMKSQGVKNVRDYLDANPKFLKRTAQTITFTDVNTATLEIFGAESKAHLLGEFKKIFVPDTLEILKDEMVAIAEGKTHFKRETINQTLDGERRNILITITFPKDHEAFKSVIVAGTDITERKQDEAKIRRQVSELSVLHAVAAATIESSNEEELIGRATHIIGETLFTDHFGILLVDKETESLYITPSYRGVSEKDKQITFPIGKKGIIGHVAATGEAYRTGDTSQEEFYIGADTTAMCSELCAPLKIGKRIIGVVNAESTKLDAFSEEEERLLTTLARQLASGIERLRKEHAEHEQRILAEALRDTVSALNSSLETDEVLDRILENVGRVVPFAAANILLLEKNTARVVRHVGYAKRGLDQWIESVQLKVNETPTLQYLTKKLQPLLISNVASDDHWISIPETDWINSYLAAPICKDNVVLGIINLDHAVPDFFTQRHAERLQAFADQVAIGLDNARLFTRTQQQIRYLEALRKIDVAISSSVDFEFVVEVITNQSQDLLAVDAVTILSYDSHLQALYCLKRKGFKTKALKNSSLRLGRGLAGRVAFDRDLLHIPDLRKEEKTIFHEAPLLADEEFISYWGVPLIAKGKINGVLEIFHRSPLSPDQEWINILDNLAGQAAIAIDNTQLFTNLEEANQSLALAYDSTLEGWARTLEIRDMETEGHSRRVTNLTIELARALNVRGEDILHIQRGALLHDIGKMGVPDSILQKPGPLNEEEKEIMHQHPVYAYEMLKGINYLKPALDIPYSHHEMWDGSGYPLGMREESIPLPARIFTVVDTYDALISDRPYRKAWSKKKALAYIQEKSGKYFDPRVVEVFIELMK